MTLADLIEAARELAPADRVRLADAVMASVEGDAAIDPVLDAAWQVDLRRRISDIENGRVELVDGRETMRVARERIAARSRRAR
ncbi:addiction module protein [Agrococcus sp. KRD186]|uniref:addiction module protein n=1 Tax=Agrococcus sp. KRD186 TaxID=2729730 RepID=UPI0019D20633|nr:addiction module protein [Agrococcus sp. KRD186]